MPKRGKYRYRLVGPQETFELHPGRNLLGRYSYCEVRVEDAEAAGEEAVVTLHDDVIELAPLPGAHVYVNGKEIKAPTELHERDALQVGGLMFTLVCREATVSVSQVRRGIARRRRLITWSLVALALLALAGSVLAVWWLVLEPGRLKSRVNDWLSHRLRRTVETRQVNLRLRTGELEISGLAVRDRAAFALEPFAVLEAATVKFSWLRLLLGSDDWVTAVSIRGGSLTLKRGADGDCNIADLLAELAAGRSVLAMPDVTASDLEIGVEASGGEVAGRPSLRLGVLEWRRRNEKAALEAALAAGADATLNVTADLSVAADAVSGRADVEARHMPLRLLSAALGHRLPAGALDLRVLLNATNSLALPLVTWKGSVLLEGATPIALSGRAECDLEHGLAGIELVMTGADSISLAGRMDYDRLNSLLRATATGSVNFDAVSRTLGGRAGCAVLIEGNVPGIWKMRADAWWEVSLPQVAAPQRAELTCAGDILVAEKRILLDKISADGWCAFSLKDAGELCWQPFGGKLELAISGLQPDVLRNALRLAPDEGTRRQGDKETRGQEDKETRPTAESVEGRPLRGNITIDGRETRLDLADWARLYARIGDAGAYSAGGRIGGAEFKLDGAAKGWSIEGKGEVPVSAAVLLLGRLLPAAGQALADLTASGTVSADFFSVKRTADAWTAVAKGRGKDLDLAVNRLDARFRDVSEVAVNLSGRPGDALVKVERLRLAAAGISADIAFDWDVPGGRVGRLAGKCAFDLSERCTLFGLLHKSLPFLPPQGRVEVTCAPLAADAAAALAIDGTVSAADGAFTFAAGVTDNWQPTRFEIAGNVAGEWLAEQTLPASHRAAVRVAGPVTFKWAWSHEKGSTLSAVLDAAELSAGRWLHKPPGRAMRLQADWRAGGGLLALLAAEANSTGKEGQPLAPAITHVSFNVSEAEREAAVVFTTRYAAPQVLEVEDVAVSGDAGLLFSLLPAVAESARAAGRFEFFLDRPLLVLPAEQALERLRSASFRARLAPVAFEIAVPGEGWLPLAVQGDLAITDGRLTRSDLKLLPPGRTDVGVPLLLEGSLDKSLNASTPAATRGLLGLLQYAAVSLDSLGVRLECRVPVETRLATGRVLAAGSVRVQPADDGGASATFEGTAIGVELRAAPVTRSALGASLALGAQHAVAAREWLTLPLVPDKALVLLEPAAQMLVLEAPAVEAGQLVLPGGMTVSTVPATLMTRCRLEFGGAAEVATGTLPLERGRLVLADFPGVGAAAVVYNGHVPVWFGVLPLERK